MSTWITGRIWTGTGQDLHSSLAQANKYDFRKRCTIIGLTIGNISGLMLRFMPTWWSFLIFWVIMHTFNHVAYIAASVYVVEVVGPSKPGIHEPLIPFSVHGP